MVFSREEGVYYILMCEKCGNEIKCHKNYCKQYGNEYHFNPSLNCSSCGNIERIAYKEKLNLVNSESKLVKCPVCNKEISKEAENCIGCGHPMQTGIKCPTCKSTNVKKISGASKVGSAVMFGIFAMGKISKTYECKACGYKW